MDAWILLCSVAIISGVSFASAVIVWCCLRISSFDGMSETTEEMRFGDDSGEDHPELVLCEDWYNNLSV